MPVTCIFACILRDATIKLDTCQMPCYNCLRVCFGFTKQMVILIFALYDKKTVYCWQWV